MALLLVFFIFGAAIGFGWFLGRRGAIQHFPKKIAKPPPALTLLSDLPEIEAPHPMPWLEVPGPPKPDKKPPTSPTGGPFPPG